MVYNTSYPKNVFNILVRILETRCESSFALLFTVSILLTLTTSLWPQVQACIHLYYKLVNTKPPKLIESKYLSFINHLVYQDERELVN